MATHYVSMTNKYMTRLQRVLTMHQGIVVNHEDLQRRVFADQVGAEGYLSMLVSQLRVAGWEIVTCRGIGYRLVSRPS